MKIGILASTENRITDYYLGNQLIRNFHVPVILVNSPDRRHATIIRKAYRCFREKGLQELISAVRDQFFERFRQRALSNYLSDHFNHLGERSAYDPGPEIIKVRDVNSAESMALLQDRGVTLLLQNGAGIIRKPLIDWAANRIINVHHGYLPDIRGCHSIAWGLLENRPEWIGVSIHLIDQGIDTGPILKRERLAIKPNSTYESLFCQATVRGSQLLVEAIKQIADKTIRIIPRQHQGTYRPAMTPTHWIKLQQKNKIRFFFPSMVGVRRFPGSGWRAGGRSC